MGQQSCHTRTLRFLSSLHPKDGTLIECRNIDQMTQDAELSLYRIESVRSLRASEFCVVLFLVSAFWFLDLQSPLGTSSVILTWRSEKALGTGVQALKRSIIHCLASFLVSLSWLWSHERSSVGLLAFTIIVIS